jgi:hypothetical protein
MQTIIEEPSIDRGIKGFIDINSVKSRVRLCSSRPSQEILASLHIPEEEPKEEDNGLHVIMQCS